MPGVTGSEPHRHKAQLLHEPEKARHKIPGHRRPRKHVGEKMRNKLRPGGPAIGRPAPLPATSRPPYGDPQRKNPARSVVPNG